MIRIAFIAMAVISIAIAVAIVFSGRIKQHIVESLLKNNEDYISIEQAQDLSVCAKLKGMTFKIPLNYMGQAYDRRAFGWRTIPRKTVKGCRPYDVDYIHIKALLPELSPIRESNMGDFGVMGPGKKVSVSLTYGRSWDYYFRNTFPHLISRPASSTIYGMHHFYDSASREDIYLSDDKPTRGLIKMRCMDNSQHQFLHPMCWVESDYQPKSEQNMGKSDPTTVLLLQYFFSIEYAPDLRTIDQNLKQLFDGFIDAAPRDLTMLDMGRFCQANEAGMLPAEWTIEFVSKSIRGA